MFYRLRAWLIRRRDKLLEEQFGSQSPQQAVAEDVSALRRQGNEFVSAGDLCQAEASFRQALAQNPGDIKCLECLGYVLKEQGRFSEARVTLRRSIDISGSDLGRYEAYYLLGEISHQQGDLPDAEKHFKTSLQLNPDFTHACKGLCDIYQQTGHAKGARELLQECIRQRPRCMDYRLWLTEICLREMDFAGVVEHLPVAIDLGATAADSYMMLGAALCRLGRVTEGTQRMAIAEAKDPALAATTQYELGYFHLKAGHLQLGAQHMQRAIALKPDYLAAHSALLMALSYTKDRQAAEYSQAAQAFNAAARRQVSQSSAMLSPAVAPRPTHGKLRVGFVSGDLLEHPVTFFLHDVLQRLDRQRIDLIAYSNNVVDHDITQSMRALFGEWHEIYRLPDEGVAELVRSHQIDVLIDLSGHTGGNRLGLFARRLAPVQVTWLGYWASTGLEDMDYVLVDAVSVPKESQEWFSETVYRLPDTRLCMSIPKPAKPVEVGPLPQLKNGHVTFGSFQQVSKITPEVLKVWAEILRQMPGARLRLQTHALNIAAIKDKLAQNIEAAGIDLVRVRLLGAVDKDAYLEAHNEVDILLDTFPYPGGTTTAFALWMGVPTITLAGDTMLSRQGVGMLHCVGLGDWVAQSEAEYIGIAMRMSMGVQAQASLRAGLRHRAETSPLFDARRFAAEFQKALFDMSGKEASVAA